MSDDENYMPKIIGDSSNIKGAKNLKASARGKYNRRRNSLAHALDQMEIAIEDILSQGGVIYKKQEIIDLKSAIDVFRKGTGIETPELAPLSQDDLDRFSNILNNLKPWEPPSSKDVAEMEKFIEQMRMSGEIPFEED